MRYFNVTLHVSLPAESEEDAEEKALNLINTKDLNINVDVYRSDTLACDPEEEEGRRRPVDEPDDTDPHNPVDMSADAWLEFYAKNPDYEDMEP